ncbi:MAG: efflux RND transporter permease subunit [Sphingobacteriaceae bacterium]|nr:efflux RND transporter permease subunit [Sphingobacteriaceae bacterium]
MGLSEISIKRPVLTIVFSLVILLLGFIAFRFLGVREYPSVEAPIITVSTNYVGANADIIESQVTEPLEESLNGIAGIRSITSVSRDGRSTITVEFELEIDLEAAANDVRDRVSRAISNLPQDVDPPTVSKADADANPILFLNIKSSTRDMLDLSDIAERVFKERLQTISGVSEVRIWGQKKYSMRLWLDPARLVAYQLTPLDVRSALLRENVELPSGAVEGRDIELTVRTSGRLVSTEDFERLILKTNGDQVVRLKDVGYAKMEAENLRTLLRRDGTPMVGTVIIPQPGSNYIDIADQFYERVEEIKRNLPDDIEVQIGFDTTEYIRNSIKEVQSTIYLAFFLVVIIIFIFLRNWRTTIIPVLVIPISLIGTFFVMYLAGFSINVLTLLGIVLAIGLVVDDAIVVLENIYSKIEEGMPPMEAAIKGSGEIFFAVIATTITLVAVFLPIIFLQGITGKLFTEFGLVIAGAVVISSFVALTLTPMLSGRILKKSKGHSSIWKWSEAQFTSLNLGYKRSLVWLMRRRWLAFVALAVSIAAIVWFGAKLPSELAPLEDRSDIRVFATAQEGATFEFMDTYMNELLAFVKTEVPEHASIITVTSPGFGASSSTNSGFSRIILKAPKDRSRTQMQVADELTKVVNRLPEARSFVFQQQTFGARNAGLPVQYVLQAPNFERLKEIMPEFLARAMKDSTFSFVDVNLKINKPEISIQIDREKARNLGVSVLDIAQTLQFGLSGQRFDYFILDGKQYQVIGQLDRPNRNDPGDLRGLFVRNDRGEMIQLDNLVILTEETSPLQRFRFNRFVSATISANPAPGKTIGQGIDAMDAIAAEVLPDDFRTALDGPSKEFRESSSSLQFAFLLALILIYMVLAAQFESFRDPFIIMFTVPLALAGAIFSLYLFNQTINIFSQIGIIMLIGLVTKNGILIVEFANQRKEAGMQKMNAIIDAAESRFRPILMTSLSTILGILPIALALGEGSESRVPMGIAVVGGMLFSTFLTLYIIPAIYSYISVDLKKKQNEKL